MSIFWLAVIALASCAMLTLTAFAVALLLTWES